MAVPSPNDRRIDYVEFTANDLDRVKRFYGEAFGWKFTDWGPAYTSFEDGRLSGGFRQIDAGEHPHEAASGDHEAHIGPLVVIYAVDLEVTQQRVTKAGGTIIGDLHIFPGGRRFYFTDPAGNYLAVWTDR